MDVKDAAQDEKLRAREDGALSVRVVAEFREMPGMRVTVAQAARLFSLGERQCERVLGALVDSGILQKDGSLFGARTPVP